MNHPDQISSSLADLYDKGFKAGRESGMREAAGIVMRKDNDGLTDQDAILSAIDAKEPS